MALGSVNECGEKFKRRELPDRFPSNPSQKYKGQGWQGWEGFLDKREFLSYSKAKEALKEHDLSSLTKYKKLIDTRVLDEAEFPRSPPKFYKKDWAGSKEYLGNHSRYSWRSFVEARK